MPTTTGKRTIYVGPADDADHKPLCIEGVCTESGVYPGSVMDFAATSGGLELMDDLATVFGKPLMVANVDEMRQKCVDEAWIVDENMVAIYPRSGEFVNVLVVTAQALVRGTAMTRSSATPGALVIAATDGTEQVLCHSDEIVTTTDTQLVRMRIV